MAVRKLVYSHTLVQCSLVSLFITSFIDRLSKCRKFRYII